MSYLHMSYQHMASRQKHTFTANRSKIGSTLLKYHFP